MKRKRNILSIAVSALAMVIWNPKAEAQGFGIGTTSPIEILHLNTLNPSNTFVRFDCQTSAGTSNTAFANSGTIPTNDNATGGALTWTDLAAGPGSPVPSIISGGGTWAQSSSTTGTTNYLKYTNNTAGNFADVVYILSAYSGNSIYRQKLVIR